MAENMNLLDDEFVRRIVFDISTTENERRRKDEYLNYLVYAGGVKEQVINRAKELLPKSWEKLRISSVSHSKKITNKKSKAYKEKPLRIFSKNDTATETYSDITSEYNLDGAFEDHDVVANRHRYGALWASLKGEGIKDGFLFRSLRPDQFSTVRNQVTGEVEVFIVNMPTADITRAVTRMGDGLEQIISEEQQDSHAQTERYAMWTKTQHRVILVKRDFADASNTNFRIINEEIEGNPNNINPIGVIPAWFDSMDNSIDNPILNPITEHTIELNMILTDINSASAQQGYGQLLYKYPEGSKVEILNSGMHTALELPQSLDQDVPSTDAEFINANPNIDGMISAYNLNLKEILEEHGITGAQLDTSASQDFSSGLDRALASADVQDVIEKNQKRYARGEQVIFTIIKAFYEFEKNTAFSNADKISVKYQKPKVQLSDKEALGNIEKQLELGMIEEWEKLQMMNPNLNEAEAKEKLERINKEKKDRMKEFSLSLPEKEESEENENPFDGE
jgi:hypothetical protein